MPGPFNPQTNDQPTPDESWRARPIQPNQALGDLFRGAAATGQAALGAIDDSAKHFFFNAAQNTTEVVNHLFGYDEAGAIQKAQTAQDLVSGHPGLAPAYNDLQKIQQAKEQGVLPNSMYWATISSKAKELRSQYPDWNMEINQMFNEVTGNHQLDSRVRTSIEQEEAQKSDSSKFQAAEMKSHGDIIEGLYPGYFDQGGAERYAAQGVTPAHALSMAMQYEGKVKMTAAAKANVAADIANGKEDVTKQTNVYSNVAMNAVTTGLQTFVNTAGGDKNLHALWQSITTGGNPPTPEQITQIDQALAGVQMNVQAQLMKEKADRKTYANMTASDFDKEDKAAIEPINTIRTLIHNQEYGLATAAIRANTMTEANTTSMLLSNNQISKAAALNKLSGSLGQTAALSAASDIAAVMLPGFQVGAFNGTVGFGDIAKTLNTDKTLNPKTASEVASTLVKSTAEAIATGKATDQNVKDFVAKQMGAGGGMFAFFSGLKTDADRYQVWNTYANPAIAERVAKLNDPATTSAYGKWMVQSFENLGDIRGIAGRVAQANMANGRNASQFVYNPKTNQFDVSPPIGADGKGLPPDSRQTEMETQANAIQPLNAGLKQVATFMKSVGIDPNDPAKGIPKVLSDLRVGDPTGDQNVAASAAPSPVRKQSEYPPDQPGVKYAKVPGSSYAPDNSGKSSASSEIDAATQVSSAREYLNSLSMHGFRMGDTSNLSPTFAVRMADAIHEAREAGLNVGVMSAFRTGDTTGSRYDAEGLSLHDKGGAIDVSGLDGPNGPATKQWAEIAAKHGIHNPYGVGNEREFNHWQMIPDKLENRPDLTAKFEAAGDQPSKWKVLENEAKVHDNLNQDPR